MSPGSLSLHQWNYQLVMEHHCSCRLSLWLEGSRATTEYSQRMKPNGIFLLGDNVRKISGHTELQIWSNCWYWIYNEKKRQRASGARFWSLSSSTIPCKLRIWISSSHFYCIQYIQLLPMGRMTTANKTKFMMKSY